jgi:phytoene/squalene synthetase
MKTRFEELWAESFAAARKNHRELEVYQTGLPVSEVTTKDAAVLLLRVLLYKEER